MGESWGDLNAGEYMFANNYVPGPNPWAVGPYATGNPVAGIRDYPINANPLNYSDYGFDTTGCRGARGRRDLERHPVGGPGRPGHQVRRPVPLRRHRRLQKKCSKNTASSTPLPAEACPGNRRWIQLIFDAFLLQQGDTDMLDARDAMIAADQDALRWSRRRHPVGGLRPTRHGQGRPGLDHRRASPPRPPHHRRRRPAVPSFATPGGPQLRGHLHHGDGQQGQGLRRRLRGPGHPRRRHRPRDPARQHGAAHPGPLHDHLRLADQRVPPAPDRRPGHRRRHRPADRRQRGQPRRRRLRGARSSAPPPARSTRRTSSTARRPPPTATSTRPSTNVDELTGDARPSVSVDLAGSRPGHHRRRSR